MRVCAIQVALASYYFSISISMASSSKLSCIRSKGAKNGSLARPSTSAASSQSIGILSETNVVQWQEYCKTPDTRRCANEPLHSSTPDENVDPYCFDSYSQEDLFASSVIRREQSSLLPEPERVQLPPQVQQVQQGPQVQQVQQEPQGPNVITICNGCSISKEDFDFIMISTSRAPLKVATALYDHFSTNFPNASKNNQFKLGVAEVVIKHCDVRSYIANGLADNYNNCIKKRKKYQQQKVQLQQ